MCIGVFAWTMDFMTDETTLTELSEGQREMFAARPQLIFIVYAIAIFSGLLGALCLLLRKKVAKLLFAISIAAVIVQFGYTFLVLDAVRLIGAAAAIPFPLVIFAIGVFLLWMSTQAGKAGWLR